MQYLSDTDELSIDLNDDIASHIVVFKDNRANSFAGIESGDLDYLEDELGDILLPMAEAVDFPH